MDNMDLENRFNYHAPDELKKLAHERVREILLQVAQEFNHTLLEGREKSIVITKLEEAMFWANASIARN
jgi:hypothetical protein